MLLFNLDEYVIYCDTDSNFNTSNVTIQPAYALGDSVSMIFQYI